MILEDILNEIVGGAAAKYAEVTDAQGTGINVTKHNAFVAGADCVIEFAKTIDTENARLKTIIAELRFFSFLQHLAKHSHSSAKAIQRSINNLELTETFMHVCKTDSQGWLWTNEGKLHFLSPFAENGRYKEMDNYEDFYTVLQIIKEQNK